MIDVEPGRGWLLILEQASPALAETAHGQGGVSSGHPGPTDHSGKQGKVPDDWDAAHNEDGSRVPDDWDAA